MTSSFRENAQYYDLLYRDKDYLGESRFVSRLVERATGKPLRQTRLLDLACGTGRHAIEFARMGYVVDGSDMSPDMLAIADERARAQAVPLRLHNESFQTCDRIPGRYDAVTAMFSAIGYVTESVELARSIGNVRKLLDDVGVFIFDFWNGAAVVDGYSPAREKCGDDGERRIVRKSSTSIDTSSRIATVIFNFTLLEANRVVREFSERHRVRYFFPDEMEDLLAGGGFEIVRRCPFLDEEGTIAANTWNLTYVARAC